MSDVRTIGTERQIETALEVLARLSEESVDFPRLRDSIALVRSELADLLDGDRFVVWHRKERGPVSPPFATRDEARRHLGEAFGGRSGLEVRRVAS